MDIVFQPEIQAKMLASRRKESVEAYNQQVQAIRQSITNAGASAKLRLEEEAQQKEFQDSVLGAFTLKGSIGDIKSNLRSLKSGKIAESVKKELTAGLDAIKEGKKVEEVGADIAERTGKSLEKKTGLAPELIEKTGLKKKIGKGVTRIAKSEKFGKIALAGEKGLAHIGPIANISLGVYDIAKDVSGGQEGWDKMNEFEQAADLTQIGAGVSDAIGLVFPPALLVGAGLGVVSSFLDVAGAEEEEEQKTEKQEEATKEEVEKVEFKKPEPIKVEQIQAKARG